MDNTEFDQKAYLSRKRHQKWQSWLFSILGGIIALNSATPIPPFFGLPPIFLGLGMLGYGYFQYRAYQKLPLHEALLLGRQMGGHLTRTDLLLNLQLTPEKTDELVDMLVREGFIEPVDNDIPPENEIRYRLLS